MTVRPRRRLAALLAIGALTLGAGAALAAATPDAIPASVLEDASGATITLTATSDNPAATSAVVAITSGPSHGSLTEGTTASMTCSSGACSGDVHYSPDADYVGSDAFSYTVDDGDGASSPADVTITVDPVNDPPSFTAGSDVPVAEDSGAYSAAWATGMSAGPADESDQTLSFELTTDSSPSLFAVEPALAADGTLTFTPAADANGAATIGFTLHDSGGASNGGFDTSGEQTFTLTIDAVNDPPSFVPGTNPVVNQDTAAFTATSWAPSINPGPPDESGQVVHFSFTTDDDASLFSVLPAVADDGTLTFTPAAGHTGTAHLTLTATDDGGTTGGGIDHSSAAVSIRVNAKPNAVNDTTFVVGENSQGQSLPVLANDTALPDPPETLTVLSVSSGLVHGPIHGTASVTAGVVTYKPAAGFYGSDFFDYTISDPFGATDTATVYLTIARDATAPAVATPRQQIRMLSSTSPIVTMTSTVLPGRVVWAGVDAGVGIGSFQLQRSINSGAFAAVTLPSATAVSIPLNFTFGSTYRFRVRAIDRNGNVSGWVTGPLFSLARSQETSGYLKYGGTWAVQVDANDSGGGARYASVAGRYVTFTRTFRNVAFVAPRSSTRGTATVYLDGVKVATISLKSTTLQYRQILWTWGTLASASHTVKIVVVGTGRIDVDCFVVLN